MLKSVNILLISIFVILLLFSACSRQDNIKIGDDYQTVVQKCGEPLMDIGSGVHILIYEMKGQNSVVKLNFSGDDKLIEISVLEKEESY